MKILPFALAALVAFACKNNSGSMPEASSRTFASCTFDNGNSRFEATGSTVEESGQLTTINVFVTRNGTTTGVAIHEGDLANATSTSFKIAGKSDRQPAELTFSGIRRNGGTTTAQMTLTSMMLSLRAIPVNCAVLRAP